MDSPKDISRIFQEGTDIDRALLRAVREALRMHKALRNPVAEWKDGRVVWIPPDELEIPDDAED